MSTSGNSNMPRILTMSGSDLLLCLIGRRVLVLRTIDQYSPGGKNEGVKVNFQEQIL